MFPDTTPTVILLNIIFLEMRSATMGSTLLLFSCIVFYHMIFVSYPENQPTLIISQTDPRIVFRYLRRGTIKRDKLLN